MEKTILMQLKALHDAEITQIISNKEKSSLEIVLINNHKKYVHLILLDCSMFRAVDFIQQNIISRINVTNSVDNIEYIKEKIQWVTSIDSEISYLNDVGFDSIFESIIRNENILVYFEPSWGAEIVAVCKKITINYA